MDAIDYYLEKVSYKVDKEDTIIEVSDDWSKAALDGKANDLAEKDNVIGTKILSYIKDENTRMFYHAMFQKSRQLIVGQTIDYRCDSSSHARYMKMQIVPEGDGALHIHNYLLKEVPFDNPVNILETNKYGNSKLKKRCSICNKLKLSDNSDWIKPEQLAKTQIQEHHVIHTVCPSCKNIDWRSKYGM